MTLRCSLFSMTILLSATMATSLAQAHDESFFGFQLSPLNQVSPLNQDTPVTQDEIVGNKDLTDQRPWHAPSYMGQTTALGYDQNTFAVPKGMEKQVQFWVDIYTKYPTTEGVIHDAENIEIIYDVVDLSGIYSDRVKQKKVDTKKKEVLAILNKLADLKSPEALNAQEKKIWDAFANVDEPNKFKNAADKNRIRFQLGQSDRMKDAIYYSGRYLEEMENIFRENNLPVELTRLAFVESSFNIMARSKVGASGIWQIMPYTAKPYKMITPYVDKRNSPLEATKLAAKLLGHNYKMLESWPLAVTGWNHGPAGVLRMTQSFGTRDLSALVQNVRSKRSFGFASRNFYASFLAALEVERNADKYFEKVTWSKPLNSQDVKLPVTVTYRELLKWFDGDDAMAQIYNPHLTSQARRGQRIPAHTVVAVPKDKYSVVLVSLARKDKTFVAEKEPSKKN